MRDFSNHNLVEGTAARDRFTSVNRQYRRSENLNNVVLFPGVRETNRSNVRSNTNARRRSNTDWYEFEAPDARARMQARTERAAARQKESECGLHAYAEYFADVIESVATNVREGSFMGTPGPVTNKVESVIAGTAVSTICLFCALL